MKKGDKVKVKSTAPHHADRTGYFAFYGQGPSQGVAVLTVEPKSIGGCNICFAVSSANIEPCD